MMKTLSRLILYSFLLSGLITGINSSAQAQSRSSAAERGKTTVEKKKSKEATSRNQTKAREAQQQSKQNTQRRNSGQRNEVKRSSSAEKNSQNRSVERKRQNTTSVERNGRKRTVERERSKTVERNGRNRTVERESSKTVERNGRNRTVERERSRTVTERNDRGDRKGHNNGNDRIKRQNDRKDRNDNIDRRRQRDRQDDKIKRRKHEQRRQKYRYRYPDRREYPRYSGRIDRRYHKHPYWRKYQRPRKQYYLKYGWSPFFCLDLTPRVRFTTYIQPIIHRRTQIVFTKEYDRYDYRPGDPIGYTVKINFDGWTRVYDNYYDRSPQLVEQFYTGPRRMQRLKRIIKRGQYYDDGYVLNEGYGDDGHPGFATIGFRRTPRSPMRTVSLNLSSPSEYQPVYFLDFMDEIDDILYND